MVCTNVPGPQFPLYLLGHKMLHCYPYVPVGGEMAVNCAILSYDGTVYFGFSGVPMLRRICGVWKRLLKLSFTELRDAAAGGPSRRNVKRKRSACVKGEGCIGIGAESCNGASATTRSSSAFRFGRIRYRSRTHS